MSDYRMVVRHVRYWRGAIHKWSTVYPFVGTIASGDIPTAIAAMLTLENGVCHNQATTLGGGVYEIAVYNSATGGVPVAVASYFDPDVPAGWHAYTNAGWTTSYTAIIDAAEVALQVEWAAGLSSSGKPVHFRKWYHSVPVTSPVPGAVDVLAVDTASLAAYIHTQLAVIGGLGLLLGRGSRLAATTAVVSSYYGNHQMPRGRRKKALVSSSGKVSFPASVLVVPGSDGSLS